MVAVRSSAIDEDGASASFAGIYLTCLNVRGLDKVLRAIDALARRDNYNMVLRSDVVLWPQQSPMDITNEVIRKVNDMKAPTPAPAGGAPTGGSK